MACKSPIVRRAVLSGERIVIVLASLELGGSERQALVLAQHLKDVENAHVEVWGFHGLGRTREFWGAHGIPWRVVPLSWATGRYQPLGHLIRLKDLVRFALALRQAKPSIILPYTWLPNVACGLVWRWTGAQLCVWNQRDEGLHRMGYETERWAISRMPFFVSNSHTGASFLIHALGVKPELVRVIHNGVALAEPELDRAAWRLQLNVSEDCFLACMVANLHSNKDHATLLRAWRLVVDTLGKLGRSVVLLLAGRSDETYKPLQQLCYTLNLDTKVKFLGMVKDIPGLLQAIDLGVFSSRSEGCPNGVLECMAAGLAVAGTDIPGIREAVGPVGHAFLAPPGDSTVLASCIITLALDPELRARLGLANRRRIETEFSPQKMCEEMVALINERKTDASTHKRRGFRRDSWPNMQNN